MPKGDLIGQMADEVLEAITEKYLSFRLAFAQAAHRQNVFHHSDKHRYNLLFRQVRTRVSKRQNRLLRVALKKGVTQEDILACIEDQRYRADLGEDPSDPLYFDDNRGYIHRPQSPYLEEAPC